jgi:hypothetical protein
MSNPNTPKTVAEQLDATKNGHEFGQVLLRMFAAHDTHNTDTDEDDGQDDEAGDD